MIGRTIISAAAALLAIGAQAQDVSSQPIAIVGATVLPMSGPERLLDRTVIVEGDRITKVGPRSRVRVPAHARVIDGTGRVLMPGLVDMHVHLAPAPGNPGDPAQRALAVMLAHGVTTARGMAGSAANLVVRGRIESGELAGPRFYAAAPALHDKSAPTADPARAAVRKAKEAGYDLIKSHELTDLAVWQAVQDEAKLLALPTAGHVTSAVGLARAMDSGQQVEHLDGTFAELIPAGAPEKAIPFGQIPPPEIIRLVAQAGDADIEALARRAVTARSWHVPTLSLFEAIMDLERPAADMIADPDMRFIPDAVLKQWAAQRDQLRASGMTNDDAAAFRTIRRRIARAFHRAGVPLMAGSDTAQAFHIWGPGLHREIAAMVDAGIPPMDALRAATIVPRNYMRSLPNGGSTLGWKADFGTVERGARADLILLDGDPSPELKHLRRPHTVIAGGRVYDRSTLDAMLDKAASDAKAAN